MRTSDNKPLIVGMTVWELNDDDSVHSGLVTGISLKNTFNVRWDNGVTNLSAKDTIFAEEKNALNVLLYSVLKQISELQKISNKIEGRISQL